ILGGAAPYTRDPALIPPRVEQLRRLGPQWGQALSAELEARLRAYDIEALVALLEGCTEKPGELDDVPRQCTCQASFSLERQIPRFGRSNPAAQRCPVRPGSRFQGSITPARSCKASWC